MVAVVDMRMPSDYFRCLGVEDDQSSMYERWFPEGARLNPEFVDLAVRIGLDLDGVARRALKGHPLSRYADMYGRLRVNFKRSLQELRRLGEVEKEEAKMRKLCGLQLVVAVRSMGGVGATLYSRSQRSPVLKTYELSPEVHEFLERAKAGRVILGGRPPAVPSGSMSIRFRGRSMSPWLPTFSPSPHRDIDKGALASFWAIPGPRPNSWVRIAYDQAGPDGPLADWFVHSACTLEDGSVVDKGFVHTVPGPWAGPHPISGMAEVDRVSVQLGLLCRGIRPGGAVEVFGLLSG